MDIVSIKSIEILDSRDNPTLKTFVTLDDGTIGFASVPSGASTGKHEALEMRDGDERYFGQGVAHAVTHVNGIIANELKGFDIEDLRAIDEHLIHVDGTENKSKLGANAILSVSLACARAYAQYRAVPLWKALNDYYFPAVPTHFPRLFVNIINGGAHADWVLDIQECIICPKESSPSSSIEIAANIFDTLHKMLHKDGLSTGVGDEGGFAPTFESNDKAFEYIDKAIDQAGYTRDMVDIATDVAASEMFKDGHYHLKKAVGKKELTPAQMKVYLHGMAQKYGIFSLEDPFAEDQWESFADFTKEYGEDHLIVGDDLYVTNPERIQQGIEMQATNAVLVKVNQIGTLLETVQAIRLAQNAGWKVIISHRSGETSDTFISDLAVACGADFLKAGSMSRSERLDKYNRLLEIEKIEY